MDNKLNFTIKTVYGRDLAYPQNKQAALICKVIGRKSLNMEQVFTLKEMGFEIVQIQVELINKEKI